MLADTIIPDTTFDTRLYVALTLAVVLISLITALIGLYTALRTAKRAASKIQEISVNVDGHLSEVVARVDQLTAALEDAHVEVPIKTLRYFPSDPLAPSDSAQPATIESKA
jgi:uncharacterized membrane protein YjgN (DUF898 family)